MQPTHFSPPVHVQPAGRPDPERGRRRAGAVLFVLFVIAAIILFAAVFIVPTFFERRPDIHFLGMAIGALLALPPAAVYLGLVRLLDRYDPEPLWALALVSVWGGVVAIGFSGFINTAVHVAGDSLFGKGVGGVLSACVSAPIVEEGFKGLGVFGIFYFVKREFDGVVDGVIYATFCALSFAAIENIIYYQGALLKGGAGALGVTFFLREILSPWGHPLYTAMTGIGFGLARESDKPFVRYLAPVGGYIAAVTLHAMWNGSATFLGGFALLLIPLWLLFLAVFIGILVVLIRRRGRIIRDHLKDELLMGTITQQEWDMASSAFGQFRAGSHGGRLARDLIAAICRLSLSKWHTARATRGQKRTVSADFIVPLRQDIARMRDELGRKLGRQLPQPSPWPIGVPPPWAPAGMVMPAPQQPHPHMPPPGAYGGPPYQGGR